MSKLSRRSFLGGAATSAAGFLTSVALPSAAHASDETPQKGDQTADLLAALSDRMDRVETTAGNRGVAAKRLKTVRSFMQSKLWQAATSELILSLSKP